MNVFQKLKKKNAGNWQNKGIKKPKCDPISVQFCVFQSLTLKSSVLNASTEQFT